MWHAVISESVCLLIASSEECVGENRQEVILALKNTGVLSKQGVWNVTFEFGWPSFEWFPQQFWLAPSAFAIASPSQIRGDRWRRREGRPPSVEPELNSKRTRITHSFSGRSYEIH